MGKWKKAVNIEVGTQSLNYADISALQDWMKVCDQKPLLKCKLQYMFFRLMDGSHVRYVELL